MKELKRQVDTIILVSEESKELAKPKKQISEQDIIENVRMQVVNKLYRGFEIQMILETQYRTRGVAKTDIGFIVFETNKYGANGFDVLEIVPFEENDKRIEIHSNKRIK